MRKPLDVRFEEKVDRSAGPDACHPWRGSTGQGGELSRGEPVPENRWVKVTCENVACLNPKHLELRAHHDDEARFWTFVQKGGPDDCWPWTGALQKEYGWFHLWLPNAKKQERGTPIVRTGKAMHAHRFAWELTHGPIEGHVPGHPELEVCVLHRCDNPKCVNPAHLWLGTDADNMADCRAKGRTAWQKARANMQHAAEKAMGIDPGAEVPLRSTDVPR